MKIYLATGNKNKLKELRKILSSLDIEVLSTNDLDIANFQVIEDGQSLEENSIKKARELSKYTKEMVVADDSGLFVRDLGGEPGIHSARYAGPGSNDKLNNKKLLEELDRVGSKKREAEFRTVISLIDKGELITKTGICKGHIALEERGRNGFGYDPLFIPEGYDKTFAELDSSIKNRISHRSRAMEKLYKYLLNKLEGDVLENSSN